MKKVSLHVCHHVLRGSLIIMGTFLAAVQDAQPQINICCKYCLTPNLIFKSATPAEQNKADLLFRDLLLLN